jgi:CelD/BcsL family acetyltransferase involved in cellulose biosynthesis
MDDVEKANRPMSASRDVRLSTALRGDAVPASSHTLADTRPAPPFIIRDVDALDALSDAWGVLAGQSGVPMQDYAWIRAAAAHFAADGRLHVVVAGTPPHITAIAPLVRSCQREACLELLGAHEMIEPMDFLYATPAALATLTDALAGFRDHLFLNRLPAQSAVIPALRRSYRGRGIVICHPEPGCPWIPLDAGWREPEQQLTAHRRSDLRRARRIAERMGPVAVDVVRPTPAALGPLLDEAFGVEAAGWKGAEGTALTDDPVREHLYRRYATAACEKGTLLVCFLRIGARAAAMQLAVTAGDRFWLLKIGYADAFARCSPGTLLMLETLRYAAAHGLQSYELLGTEEPWTQVWTSHVRPCVSLRAYPASVRGITVFAADVGRSARRRVGRVLRRPG